jgi:hypothetical protein
VSFRLRSMTEKTTSWLLSEAEILNDQKKYYKK